MIVPKKLLPLTDASIMYKVRLSTTKPSISHSGINLCIVSSNGDGVLKRFTAFDVANRKEPYEFYGPKIDDVSTVLIAPESDELHLGEVSLQVDSNKYDFTYNGTIGGRRGELAATFFPHEENSINMKPVYDAEYYVLKDSIIINAIEYTLVGASVVALMSELGKGYAFAMGGMLGVMYIMLLESAVDSLGKPAMQALSSNVLRLGVIFGLSAAIITKHHDVINEDNSYLLIGGIGFLTQRLAVIKNFMQK